MKTHTAALACSALLLTLPGFATTSQTPPSHTSTLGTAKTVMPASTASTTTATETNFTVITGEK